MSAVKTEAAPYLAAFRDDPREPAWLAQSRRAALASFGARGFPSRREEAWRFTNLRALTERIFPPVSSLRHRGGGKLGAELDLGVPTFRLVFANGIFQSGPSELPT